MKRITTIRIEEVVPDKLQEAARSWMASDSPEDAKAFLRKLILQEVINKKEMDSVVITTDIVLYDINQK